MSLVTLGDRGEKHPREYMFWPTKNTSIVWYVFMMSCHVFLYILYWECWVWVLQQGLWHSRRRARRSAPCWGSAQCSWSRCSGSSQWGHGLHSTTTAQRGTGREMGQSTNQRASAHLLALSKCVGGKNRILTKSDRRMPDEGLRLVKCRIIKSYINVTTYHGW